MQALEKEASDFRSDRNNPLSSFRSDNNLEAHLKFKQGELKELKLFPGFKLDCVAQFKSKFTGTHKFKYRLKYEGIPIYGSSIIVELDDDGEVLFTDSSSMDQDKMLNKDLFPPSQPTIYEKDLKSLLEKYYHNQGKHCSFNDYELNVITYYYFYPLSESDPSGKFKLVYITNIKLDQNVTGKDSKIQPLPEPVDYIINARPQDYNSLEILGKLSRIRTFG